MTRRIIPHAPDAMLDATVLAIGEIAFGETSNRPRFGDGGTPGGRPAALLDEVEAKADAVDLDHAIDRITLVEGTITSGRLGYASWADLSANTTAPVDSLAEVSSTDAGTHNDPVSGQPVKNAGVFKQSTAGWHRLYDTDAVAGAASAIQAAASAAAALQAASAIGRSVNAALDEDRNLFSRDRVVSGYLAQDGTVTDSPLFFTSDFIDIMPGQAITATAPIIGNDNGYVVLYDAAQTRIAAIQNGNVKYPPGQPIVAPNDPAIRKIRVSCAVGDTGASTLMVVHGSDAPTAYRAHGEVDRYTMLMQTRAALLAEAGTGRNLAASAPVTINRLLNVNSGNYDYVAGYFNAKVTLPPVNQITVANAIEFNAEYGLGWLDVDSKQIGKINGPIAAGATYAVPFGAAYLVAPGQNAPIEVYAGGTVPATRSTGPLMDEGASIVLAADLMLAALPGDTNFWDPLRVRKNAYRDRQTGAYVDNPVCAVTHDMPCRPGKPVIFSVGNAFSIDAAGLAWLDRSHRIIGSIPPPLVAGQTYDPPAGAAFWFCNYPLASPEPYFGIGTALPADRPSLTGPWNGAIWAMSGDSIVAQGEWAPVAEALLGVGNYINWGVAGSHMADVLTNRSPSDFQGLDLYGVSTGTNDFGDQTPLGTAADAKGAATFWGQTRNVIETALTAKPTLRMFFMTPMHRGDEFTKAAGSIALRSYRDAILECAMLYGLPVYDQYALSGIGPATFGAYMKSDGFPMLHPNSTGGRLIGRQVAAWINSLGDAR